MEEDIVSETLDSNSILTRLFFRESIAYETSHIFDRLIMRVQKIVPAV
jgi:hypothetical protein